MRSSSPHAIPASPRVRVSMRWWLALAFAAIAAVTALAVAQVVRSQTEDAVRDRAQELAAGSAVAAAADLVADSPQTLAQRVPLVARARRLSLYVFTPSGELVSSPVSLGNDVRRLPTFDTLVERGRAGRRHIESIDRGKRVAVTLSLRGGEQGFIVAVASRPDLVAGLTIVRERIVRAALWATLAGAVVGLVVASLIALRLRAVARAAAEIEQGSFERPVVSRFPDELGALATTVDAMRRRLRDSFAQLEDDRDRLERLLEQLQEGVVAVDRELRIDYANTAARTLTGERLDVGSDLPEPWPAVSLRETARSLSAYGSSPTRLRVEVDPGRTYSLVGLPSREPDGTSVIVLTDVSARERRERAEREFVANAAHELRTPLAAISSAVEVLQQGAKERPPERDRFLAVVERQSERLARLVRALLVLARAQTGSEGIVLEAVSLDPLLDEIRTEVEERGVAIGVDRTPGLVVHGHADLLRQVLDNLVSNALKHAGGRGLRLHACADGAHVDVEVSDTGPGMAAARAARALDRFYRGGRGGEDGFGLGLSIVREVMAALGGSVDIDSAPEHGTTVRLRLQRVERVST